MKTLLIAMIALLSLQAFAQRNDRTPNRDSSRELLQCLQDVKRLENRISDLLSRGRNDAEVDALRRENQRLAEDNRNLQYQIDELSGRNLPKQVICSAACASSAGIPDARYLGSAVAPSKVEAEFLSKKNVQDKYSCNFGIRPIRCEDILSNHNDIFCSVACTNSAGIPDERYSAGGRGRNSLEAEIAAAKKLLEAGPCNFGLKVVSCSN